MTKTTLIAALLAVGFAGAVQAGEYHPYTDADRAFYSEYEGRPAPAPVQAPRQQQYYQGGFGSFSAAGTARTLGY